MEATTRSALEAHLTGLHESAVLVIRESIANQSTHLGRVLRLDLDIKVWEERLRERPEIVQLTAARRQLGFALYAVATGAYSHAYGSLRTFLELSVAAVYFSANELERRRWLADRTDFSWSHAFSTEDGVLTRSFIREFDEDAAGDSTVYAERAASCYRLCSQFIHGKSSVTNTLPEELAYSDSVLGDWCGVAREAAESVLFLLYGRYGAELLQSEDHYLTGTIEHSFSHLPSVRRALGLPIDEESRVGR